MSSDEQEQRAEQERQAIEAALDAGYAEWAESGEDLPQGHRDRRPARDAKRATLIDEFVEEHQDLLDRLADS